VARSTTGVFLISNFLRFLNVVFFPLGDSPLSEFYVPTFRNNLSVLSSYNWYIIILLELTWAIWRKVVIVICSFLGNYPASEF